MQPQTDSLAIRFSKLTRIWQVFARIIKSLMTSSPSRESFMSSIRSNLANPPPHVEPTNAPYSGSQRREGQDLHRAKFKSNRKDGTAPGARGLPRHSSERRRDEGTPPWVTTPKIISLSLPLHLPRGLASSGETPVRITEQTGGS